MKNVIYNLLKAFTMLLLVFSTYTLAASDPPPPPGGGSNTQGNKLGGKAPIGSGLLILMGLGAAYGGRKIYKKPKPVS